MSILETIGINQHKGTAMSSKAKIRQNFSCFAQNNRILIITTLCAANLLHPLDLLFRKINKISQTKTNPKKIRFLFSIVIVSDRYFFYRIVVVHSRVAD